MLYVTVPSLFLSLSSALFPHLLLVYLAQYGPGLVLPAERDFLLATVACLGCVCVYGGGQTLCIKHPQRILNTTDATWIKLKEYFSCENETPHKSRQNSERDYTLLPPPNAHLPQVSPLHYCISLALLASLQPLSRLIISSSNGRGRQWCRLRPRHITAAQIYCARALFFAHAPAPYYSSYAESLKRDCVSKNGKWLRLRRVCVCIWSPETRCPQPTFVDLTLTAQRGFFSFPFYEL